jgi:hypothetical protein
MPGLTDIYGSLLVLIVNLIDTKEELLAIVQQVPVGRQPVRLAS